MKGKTMKPRLIAGLAALALAFWAAEAVRAGGPLATVNNRPVLWASRTIQRGPLNAKSVQVNEDGSRTVFYTVDSGSLGPLNNAQAVALVDHIFEQYNGIGANIRFERAGNIRHPATGDPIDINGNNFGLVAGNTRTFQNPIIFDSDGSITGTGGVLGFAGIMALDNNDGEIGVSEAIVVLNGTAMSGAFALEPASFMGVFTHEFGHFAGPLDHAQINGYIALDGLHASSPPGFTEGQLYDVYAPFTETMFPFVYDAPFFGSLIANEFPDSGFFVATLDLDTQNAMKNLYPPAGYRATDPDSENGAIEGRVVIRTLTGDVPVNGINVVARRISNGVYPPLPNTAAFDAVKQFETTPFPTNGRIPKVAVTNETEPLRIASSALTGYPNQAGVEAEQGYYKIDGLPPGEYLVEIQTIMPEALDGSSIGHLGTQFPLLVQEFYDGLSESATDDPSAFTPVVVVAGEVTSNIDIVLNGFSDASLAAVAEKEKKNNKPAKAPLISIPAEITGTAGPNDGGKTSIRFSNGVVDKLEDLYKFQLTSTRTVYFVLEPENDSADLDLYLFTADLKGKNIPLSDPRLLDASLSAGSYELIARTLPAGTYFLALSAFEGKTNYRLRIYVSD